MKRHQLSKRDYSVTRRGRSTLPARGFTLLELIMVMTIIVILAAVGVSAYQSIQLKARETVLKQNLNAMRRAIDEYAADKERLPSTLEDLIPHYIREVPIDPMTGEADWNTETGEDTVSAEGGRSGLVDVHSNAPGEGTDGKPYSEY